MPNPLYIFAEIKPKPEFFDDAYEAITQIIEQTRAESGCYLFELYRSPAGDCLYLFEQWQDQAALDLHHSKPYTAAVFKLYENWLAQSPNIVPMFKAA